MKLRVFLILIVFTSVVWADNEQPEKDFCFGISYWFKDQSMTGKELCKLTHPDDPNACQQVKNIGQGICVSAKFHFGLCSTVQTLSAGICKALGQPDPYFCSSLVDPDQFWVDRLRTFCGINPPIF